MSPILSSMLKALGSSRSSAELSEQLNLYGRRIGSWRLDVDFHLHDGTHIATEGEAIFDWVLEGSGRAVTTLALR